MQGSDFVNQADSTTVPVAFLTPNQNHSTVLHLDREKKYQISTQAQRNLSSC